MTSRSPASAVPPCGKARRRLAGAALLLALALPALAGERDHDHDDDHERARQAVEAGEILPLRAILDRVDRVAPGQVVDVELEREYGRRWVYRVKVVRADGLRVRLKLDAQSGEVLAHRPGHREH